MSENLISVNNVSVNFDYQENFISTKQKIHAVNNINIKIKKGSFFGLVGESGSGKTTLGRAILGANKISSGNVIVHDDERDYDLTNINKQDLKEYRKKAQIIFLMEPSQLYALNTLLQQYHIHVQLHLSHDL